MTLTLHEIVLAVSAWMWPFIRIGAMLSIAPLFGANYVPARVRIGLAVAFSVVIIPIIPEPPAITAFSAEGILITIQQVMIGLALGFVLRMIWSVFELAGHVMSQPMGLHFASMVDPNSGVQVPVVSQFYVIAGSLIFLSLNGHLIFIQLMADSFSVLPVSTSGIAIDGFMALVNQMGWVFSTAVLIALPGVTALLIMNFSFGVMGRAAPQLNIFAVGFPIALVLGFVVMFTSLPTVLTQFESMFSDGLLFLQDLAAGNV